MSLCALRREYQRSIDKIFEDYSVQSRAQAEPYLEEVESNQHRSVINLHNRRERYVQRKTQNTTTPPVTDGYEYIHHDIKAWACFLDSKREK